MPKNPDMAPVRSQATLYPNWVQAWVTKPQGSDLPRPYQTPRQDADRDFILEEELGTNSVFNLLALGSQSSQPSGSQPSLSPDTTTGAAGPKTPPHFSEASPTIPPFDLALRIASPNVTRDSGRKCIARSGIRVSCQKFGTTRDWPWS